MKKHSVTTFKRRLWYKDSILSEESTLFLSMEVMDKNTLTIFTCSVVCLLLLFLNTHLSWWFHNRYWRLSNCRYTGDWNLRQCLKLNYGLGWPLHPSSKSETLTRNTILVGALNLRHLGKVREIWTGNRTDQLNWTDHNKPTKTVECKQMLQLRICLSLFSDLLDILRASLHFFLSVLFKHSF